MHESEDSSTYWTDKCIRKFCLKPCLTEQQHQDGEETWKRYYEYRRKHNPKNAIGRGEHNEDDEYDVIYDEGDLLKTMRRSFHRIAQDLGEAGQDWIHSTLPTVLEVELDDDAIRTGVYRSYIFSPYQIPHAIEFTHRYHHRTRYSCVEFSAFWGFSLIRFDGRLGGDETQRKLTKYYPKGVVCRDALYDAEDDMEYLSSVTCDEPPNEDAPWTFIPKLVTSNLNPTTIRRLRDWLYGISAFTQSRNLISDFDLMRLFFASAALPNFECLMDGDLGYTWRLDMDDPEFHYLQQQGYASDDNWPAITNRPLLSTV